MKPQIDLFLFFFWRKLRTPKRHFEIIWPLPTRCFSIFSELFHCTCCIYFHFRNVSFRTEFLKKMGSINYCISYRPFGLHLHLPLVNRARSQQTKLKCRNWKSNKNRCRCIFLFFDLTNERVSNICTDPNFMVKNIKG